MDELWGGVTHGVKATVGPKDKGIAWEPTKGGKIKGQ